MAVYQWRANIIDPMNETNKPKLTLKLLAPRFFSKNENSGT
jgi:hypothetical protein